jgi:hypothetical protein
MSEFDKQIIRLACEFIKVGEVDHAINLLKTLIGEK